MKWQIPAKTFLLGEYAAIAEASAIIITTTPCFELSLTDNEGLHGIHPQSPAGLWWEQEGCSNTGLTWFDPYYGQGGLGASSAQFAACYLATCYLKHETPTLHSMLTAYYQCAWSGSGLRPSGYDVIAQSMEGCVFINKQKKQMHSFNWPFQELSFLLIHTGVKLATHHHLQESALPKPIEALSALVDDAQRAFEQHNSQGLISAVNGYHHLLSQLNLVAPHSQEFIESLKQHPEILAIKGCGAMGADVLLILCAKAHRNALKTKLIDAHWSVISSEEQLSTKNQNSGLIYSL